MKFPLKAWLSLAFLFLFFQWELNSGFGQQVRVRIQPTEMIESFEFQALGDEVIVTAGDTFPELVTYLNTLEKVEVSSFQGWVLLRKDGRDLGRFPQVFFYTNDAKPLFNLILNEKSSSVVTYADHLEVNPRGKSLLLINHVFIENYVKGVIHAEAGHHKSLEFFKVQALSARTYALRNLNRHGNERYNLCSTTHCQVYRGQRGDTPLIERAVMETEGQVIVYPDSELVDAVFSANCGGWTANSEDVWVSRVDYLRSMPDYNFCEGFSNHAWHMNIPKWDFLNKMGTYHKTQALKFEIQSDVSGRVKKIILNDDPKLTISGEELRRMFRLKSSKFNIFESGNLLFIEGAGYGHGVGMCQDGAFYLSEMGLDYDKIIKHYYQGVEIKQVWEVWGENVGM